MKNKRFVLCCFLLLCSVTYARADTFEGITYTTPKGWQKKTSSSAVQFAVDGAKGTGLVTLFKAIPGSDDAKKNFTASWETIVKETIQLTAKPQMQPPTRENGWIAESGVSPYEIDGKKGLALLITMTANRKMVNILVLTNTDAYQADIAAFLESVQLPKIAASAAIPDVPKATTPAAPRPGKFQFNTTNFDDGWTAVEQADWARVTKGNVTALVHYPNQKVDAYNSVLKAGLQNAWNLLVAPRYTNIRNFELKPIQSFQSIDFAEADADDKATGKTVHVVLFKKHFNRGNGKYIEFITDSKQAFEQEFGPYHNNEFGWDKLVNLQGRNKFDVSSADLVGKWSTQDYASLSYYYVSSGGYAGATATSTADAFTFAPSGTYQSDHSGASGVVGNQKFSRQVYKGEYSARQWKLTMTNRFKGAPETFNCYFEAVKGGRILMLTDRNNFVLSLGKQP